MSGFEEPAGQRLQKVLQIDLHDPRFVHRALDALQPYVDALH